MIIHSKFKDYEVIKEANLEFINKFKDYEDTQYVVDKKVYKLYESILNWIPKERLIEIDAIEENKVIDTALDICEKMTEIPAKRNARLLSIGGGIIQDITGFVANVLYRGIKWTFVPTTLLASCDSCIGGKTSLNYKKFKNLLGTFYPPDEIHICSEFFKTLSDRDFKSGLGEVIKFNIMAGRDGLNNIEKSIEKLLERDNSTVNSFVESSLSFKSRFIEIDEFDKGERIKLNFAHTFGHAIEAVSNYEIPHGTAVAIGMIIADYISAQRGLLEPSIAERSEKVLLKVINIDASLLEGNMDEVIKAIRKDKKQTNTALTAVLMVNDGKEKDELKVIHDMTENEVIAGFDYFRKIYGSVNQMN